MTEFEKQQKKDAIREKIANVKEKADKATEWCKEHPVETAIVLSVGISTVVSIGRNIRRHQIIKRENAKARTLYDPHTGMTWKLKRPLTNEEKVFILHHAKMGVDYHNSLMYLDLLPKR
jgi:hypothetical protein